MSYNITLSGLDSINKQIEGISNNIANVSTTGYRASTTHFSALYNNSSPAGVEVSKVSQNFAQYGATQNTGQALDLAIEGAGFFIVADGDALSYSRAGSFQLDANRNIVDAFGKNLQGFPLDANGDVMTGALADLTVGNEGIVAKATTEIDFSANFDSRAVAKTAGTFDQTDPSTFNSSYTSQIFDSLGNEHTVTQYFVKTGVNTWEVHMSVDGEVSPTTGAAGSQLTFDLQGNLETVEGNNVYDAMGNLAAPTPTVNVARALTNGAENFDIDIDFVGTLQLGADFSVSSNQGDGFGSGQLVGVTVTDDGTIMANYSNGISNPQGVLALANFNNPEGLTSINETAWEQSYKSGNPVYGQPGSGVLGGINSGALEGSNVELTSELVGLIGAQRNYQANAQTMQTLNQITQTLFQSL